MFCQLCWHRETLDCCTIHHLGVFIKEKIHWGSRERETGQETEIKRVCLCVSVCTEVTQAPSLNIHRESKLAKFFSEQDRVIDRLMGNSAALY